MANNKQPPGYSHITHHTSHITSHVLVANALVLSIVYILIAMYIKLKKVKIRTAVKKT